MEIPSLPVATSHLIACVTCKHGCRLECTINNVEECLYGKYECMYLNRNWPKYNKGCKYTLWEPIQPPPILPEELFEI